MYWLSGCQLILFFATLAVIPFLGNYMVRVFEREKPYLHVRALGWLERALYKIAQVNPNEEMDFKEYAKALLLFNFLGFLILFIILKLQYFLPLNSQRFPGVSTDLAFNISSSFVTNTNWQSYSGETTLSYYSQMVGLTVQNFLSAACGNCVLLALIRGLKRKTSQTIGNFWSDLVRTIVYLLLPLAIGLALFLVSQGVVQSLSHYVEAQTLEGGKQIIAVGPAASQIAIKQLGTNGGGFFGTNSCHPFENPTALSNFFELLAILIIPVAQIWAYGRMIQHKRHGILLLIVCSVIWLGGVTVSQISERLTNPALGSEKVLEGKELRFGTTTSLLWATSTTDTSNGSVNTMHSSLSPLAGGVCLFNIMLGEVIFGGVGVGLCGLIMFVLLTVFLAGLMVGRTPEYLGKKIERRDIQWVIIAVLTPVLLILFGSAFSLVTAAGRIGMSSKGPHGLSEILYAYSSAAGNNGSAFGGLQANTLFYNLTLGFTMLIGRLAIVIPSLAIAASFAAKKITPTTVGTLAVDIPLFAILLAGVILIVGALTFFPALSLGPIVEHLLMRQGQTF